MKLDHIENINAFGDSVVRLYDFGMDDAAKFKTVLEAFLNSGKDRFDLNTVEFIEARNCTLTLRLCDEDEGIVTEDGIAFFCDLTKTGFANMLVLLEPFCHKETKGYQYLYDIDNPIDLLLSPAGTW